MIPGGFEAPKERNLGSMSSIAHGIRSGNVVVKNSKTIHISELYYDGAGPGMNYAPNYISKMFFDI